MRQAVRAIVVRGDELLVMHRNKFGVEYYTLIGGGVEEGEELEAALHRELWEETGLKIKNPHLVYVEDAHEPYGTQYVYICEYAGGEIELHPQSDEAKLNSQGQNLYMPEWLPIRRLPDSTFVSPGLKERLIAALPDGPWPSPAERFAPADAV